MQVPGALDEGLPDVVAGSASAPKLIGHERLSNGHDRLKRLVVIDERRLLADALAALLTGSGLFTVSTCSVDRAQAGAVDSSDSDLALVIVGHSREAALGLVRELKHASPHLRIALIADAQDPELIRCVLNQEAVGLVLTGISAEDFTVTLDHVLRGNTALPAGWRTVLEQSDNDPVTSLSTRQREVLELLAKGCSYEEIGARLIISANTVKFHVHTTYVRLGVTNRMAAVNLWNAHLVKHGRPADKNHTNGWGGATRDRVE